jgi:cytosine deaminase
MITTPDYQALLQTAIAEARQGLAEGGVPIGAALYHNDGRLLGCGHNRRVQEGDPSVHGETDAFRKAGRQRRYQDTIMVTTLAPCWYCSGLVRQFNIGTVVVGESRTFQGGIDWLREKRRQRDRPGQPGMRGPAGRFHRSIRRSGTKTSVNEHRAVSC